MICFCSFIDQLRQKAKSIRRGVKTRRGGLVGMHCVGHTWPLTTETTIDVVANFDGLALRRIITMSISYQRKNSVNIAIPVTITMLLWHIGSQIDRRHAM
jgi:hypothetical protein